MRFADFVEPFLAIAAARNRATEAASKERILRVHLLPAFGELEQVTYARVQDSVTAKLRTHRKKSINNQIGVLRRFLAIAVKRGLLAKLPEIEWLRIESSDYRWLSFEEHLACTNPVSGVERPPVPSSLDYLSKDEVAALLAHAEAEASDLHPMIATAVYSGMRLGELMGLRWTDVHLEDGRIDVLCSYATLPKSGKPRYLPLHPELARILREWQKRCPATEDGLVFPVRGTLGRWVMGHAQSHGDALPSLMRAAGCHVPAKWWHALRHTFASHAVMAGMSLYTLQQLLGHSVPTMTQRYAHLASHHLAGEVARLSFAAPAPSEVADLGEERRRRIAENGPLMNQEG